MKSERPKLKINISKKKIKAALISTTLKLRKYVNFNTKLLASLINMKMLISRTLERERERQRDRETERERK